MVALGKTTTDRERANNLEAIWSAAAKEKMGVSIDVVMFDSVDEIPVGILDGER